MPRANDIKAFLTMHSYSQLWLTPWGYTTDVPNDYADLVLLKGVAVLMNITPYLTTLNFNIIISTKLTLVQLTKFLKVTKAHSTKSDYTTLD